MHLLEVRNLRKRFGEIVAVDGVGFHVGAGEVFGLLGPNGAGKSTTMLIIAGLLAADSGEVLLGGEPLRADAYHLRSRLGMVPQDLAIYPELSARGNLHFFGRLYGLRGDELAARTADALKRTGLVARADGQAGTFSGGMKRRLNFGIALMHRPKLLILDEPTVGVDPQSRAHLLDGVARLRAEGVGVIYASHYMEEVQAICDRVAIVDHGRVLACDTLPALLSRMTARLTLRIDEPPPHVLRELRRLDDVKDLNSNDGELTIELSREGTRLNESLVGVTRLLEAHGIPLKAIDTHDPNLERLFLDLTGRRLRD